MNIVYISQYFPPETEPSASKVHELARIWVGSGHKVKVVTGFPHYPTGVVSPEYDGKLWQREKVDGVEVLRTWLWPAASSQFWPRTFSHISFTGSAIFRSLICGSCDIVLCTSPPLEVGLAGVVASVVKKCPLVLELRDLWPDDIIQFGLLKGRISIALAKRLERMVYRRAARVVPVSPGFVSYLVKEGVPEDRIVMIPNGTNVHLFKPDPEIKKKEREALALGERHFLVEYVGTHGMQHHLETILEAAQALQQYRDIIFLFVGDGREKPKLVTLNQQMMLKNVRFVPTQPRQRAAHLIAAADACIVHSEDISINHRNIQAKLFDYLAGGHPVIVGSDGQMRELIERTKAGIWVGPERAEKLADAVLQLYRNRRLAEQLGSNGRDYALKHFSRERIAQRYEKVFQEVISHRC